MLQTENSISSQKGVVSTVFQPRIILHIIFKTEFKVSPVQ